MSAHIVTLCTAVADALTAGAFSETFTAEYEYAPNYSAMDAKTLRVVVTDAGGEVGLMTRSRLGYMDKVRVVILWRVDATGTGLSPEKMNRGLVLMDEIINFLMGRTMGNYSQTGEVQRGLSEKDKEHYFPGNLDQRVFATTAVFGYRTTEVIPKDSSEGGSA